MGVLGVIVPFVRVPWQMKILILSLAVIKPGVILVDVSVTVARRPTQLVQRSVIAFTVTTWTTVHAVTSVLRDVHVPNITALAIQLNQKRQLRVAVQQQLQHPRCCVRKLTAPIHIPRLYSEIHRRRKTVKTSAVLSIRRVTPSAMVTNARTRALVS